MSEMGKAGTMVPSTREHLLGSKCRWGSCHYPEWDANAITLISALSSGGEHREESPCGIPEITHEITSQRRLKR